jgi:hypothetical protein
MGESITLIDVEHKTTSSSPCVCAVAQHALSVSVLTTALAVVPPCLHLRRQPDTASLKWCICCCGKHGLPVNGVLCWAGVLLAPMPCLAYTLLCQAALATRAARTTAKCVGDMQPHPGKTSGHVFGLCIHAGVQVTHQQLMPLATPRATWQQCMATCWCSQSLSRWVTQQPDRAPCACMSISDTSVLLLAVRTHCGFLYQAGAAAMRTCCKAKGAQCPAAFQWLFTQLTFN